VEVEKARGKRGTRKVKVENVNGKIGRKALQIMASQQ
jgi:hypothetical protein